MDHFRISVGKVLNHPKTNISFFCNLMQETNPFDIYYAIDPKFFIFHKIKIKIYLLDKVLKSIWASSNKKGT